MQMNGSYALRRGAATDKAVRTVYSLDGLLPSRRLGLQAEVDRAKFWLDRCSDKLDKFQALMTLKETNRDAFYALLLQNVDSLLPIVYTPTGFRPYSFFNPGSLAFSQLTKSIVGSKEFVFDSIYNPVADRSLLQWAGLVRSGAISSTGPQACIFL